MKRITPTHYLGFILATLAIILLPFTAQMQTRPPPTTGAGASNTNASIAVALDGTVISSGATQLNLISGTNMVLRLTNASSRVDAQFNAAGSTGSGTPGGNTEEVQFNQAGAFAATNEFKWRRAMQTLLITNSSSQGLQLSPTAVIGKGDTVNVGSHANPIKTNSMNYFFMATGAKKNAQLRSVSTVGQGEWGNPAGGNGNSAGGNEAAIGAILFAETNVTDQYMMQDSTNEFRYRRTDNTLILTNKASSIGVNLSANSLYGQGDSDFYLGVGNAARWRLESTTGHLMPQTTNTFDLGAWNYPVRTNYANQFAAKTGVDIGTSGAGLISFGSSGGAVSNLTAIKWAVWTNYVPTVSNFVFSFDTNRSELKNQTNVVFTNIVEEATAVSADMTVHIHNTTGVTMGLAWPPYGAQHGYFFGTNANNPIITTTTLAAGQHGVASFTAFGTNIFAVWTVWP